MRPRGRASPTPQGRLPPALAQLEAPVFHRHQVCQTRYRHCANDPCPLQWVLPPPPLHKRGNPGPRRSPWLLGSGCEIWIGTGLSSPAPPATVQEGSPDAPRPFPLLCAAWGAQLLLALPPSVAQGSAASDHLLFKEFYWNTAKLLCIWPSCRAKCGPQSPQSSVSRKFAKEAAPLP